MITFGTVLGRTTPLHLLVIGFVANFFYELNVYITILVLEAVDLGGTITVHTFGAVFGIALAYAMFFPWLGQDDVKEYDGDRKPNYLSNVFAMIGTIIIFITFPAFNAFGAPNGSQFRVVINTFLAETSSVALAFIASRTFRSGKFFMQDIQRATLAGGIVAGGITPLVISPGGSMVIGAVSGLLSVVSYAYVEPFLVRYVRLVDTAGVLSLHGVIGVLGAVTGILASAAVVAEDDDDIYGQTEDDLFPQDDDQPGYQTAALAITLAIASLSGAGLGAVLGLVNWAFTTLLSNRLAEARDPYTDETEWEVPADFEIRRVPEEVGEEES